MLAAVWPPGVCAAFLGSSTAPHLAANADGRLPRGRSPRPGAAAAGRAEAAGAAGVAPRAAPVVVVKAGTVAGEVLSERHFGQVVPAWPEPRDANRVAIHCF